jgi:hypothetical protein
MRKASFEAERAEHYNAIRKKNVDRPKLWQTQNYFGVVEKKRQT